MSEAPAAPLLLKSRRGHPGRRQLWNQPRRRRGVRSAGAEADRLVWNWGSLGFYKPSSAASRVALSGFIHSFCAKFGTANSVPATAEVFMPYRGPEAGIFPKPTLRLRVSAVDDLEGIPGSGQQGRETGRRRMIAPTRQDPEQVTIVGRWAQSHRAVWETVRNSSRGPTMCQPQPRSLGMQQRIEPIKPRLQELMTWRETIPRYSLGQSVWHTANATVPSLLAILPHGGFLLPLGLSL